MKKIIGLIGFLVSVSDAFADVHPENADERSIRVASMRKDSNRQLFQYDINDSHNCVTTGTSHGTSFTVNKKVEL